MNEKTKVAILGATGSVGQKFIELLIDHPWFEIAELAASERSAGKNYGDATNWVMHTPLPDYIRDMKVVKSDPQLVSSKVIFSAMDASVAGPIEEDFANDGRIVISNARNHRYDSDVPLIIPEVNYNHLDILKIQKYKGCIITNPNCSTIGLVLALKPLQEKFGIESVNVVTMQAISGAGYPGVPSLDMVDNIVPLGAPNKSPCSG